MGSPKLDHNIFCTWASWIVHFLNLGTMNEPINDELATSYKVMYNPNLPTTILSNHKIIHTNCDLNCKISLFECIIRQWPVWHQNISEKLSTVRATRKILLESSPSGLLGRLRVNPWRSLQSRGVVFRENMPCSSHCTQLFTYILMSNWSLSSDALKKWDLTIQITICMSDFVLWKDCGR